MKKALPFVLLLLLAACGEDVNVPVTPWKDTDKKLSCEQLRLEMNDARYWQEEAKKKMEFSPKDIIWLPGYFGTRISAKDAFGITSKRMAYLNNIYKIKGCDDPYYAMP